MNLRCFISSQAPPAPRARRFSEDSTVSAKEDEGGSSDGADEPSHQDASQRGKPGDGKAATKVEDLFFSVFPSFIPVSNSGSESKAPPPPTLMPGWTALTVGERKKSSGLNNSPCPSELWIWLVQLVSIKACQQRIPLWR